jgi:hypothetical protein
MRLQPEGNRTGLVGCYILTVALQRQQYVTERKNTIEQGRMSQKKNDLTKTRVLLIFYMFFIPSCNLKFSLFMDLFRIKKVLKIRGLRKHKDKLFNNPHNKWIIMDV